MDDCHFCGLQENIIYEDEKVKAVLKEKPAADGHILVIPKEHHTILEQVPEDLLQHLFIVANQVSALVFDKLQAHGTNIIVENGVAAGQSVPHVAVHIIPRSEDDGLDFQWEPKTFSDDDLEGFVLLYKDGMKEKKEEKEEQVAEPEQIGGAENYLIKQLERLP